MAGSSNAVIPDVPPSELFGGEVSGLHYALMTIP